MGNDIITAGGFNQISADSLDPGFEAEIDASQAGRQLSQAKVLLVGPKLAAGTLAAGTVQVLPGADGTAARDLAGRGSILADMAAAFRQGGRTMPVYILPVDDDGAGVAASQTVTVTGPATAAGTVVLYVGDVAVKAGVASGDADADIATALAAAINANPDLPVTAAANLAVVTVTCRHKGEIGNDLHLAVGRRGEDLPAGVTITIANGGYLDNGATNPDQTPAIAAIAGEVFDFVVVAWTDSQTKDAWDAEMLARWAPDQMLYGWVWDCRRGTLNELITAGELRDGYATTLESYQDPSAPWKRVAREVAQTARALANHPARGLQGLTLIGEMPRPAQYLFSTGERSQLNHAGIATTETDEAGNVKTKRIVTNKRLDASGEPNTALLDVTTPYTLMRIVRELKSVIETEYINRRAILVDDGTPVAQGVPHVTARKLRARLVAHYDRLQLLGFAENKSAFEDRLLVNRDPDDPTRINIYYPPDVANPLYRVAAQVGFSLQWPADQVQ